MNVRVTLFALILAGSALAADPNAPLGSSNYLPTPERPIGWRGDGTGRFPAATPPTTWERKRNGTNYATKNIIWATPLPNWGVGSPIIVGPRIFITTEVADLICIEKATGRIAWIRSAREFEALSEEDRKATAELDGLMATVPQMEKTNAELVEQLNAHLATAATTTLKPPGAAAKKKELEKKIDDTQKAADKKQFERYWGQGVFGFSGQTPTCDGKRVCVFYTTGVSACYDLDGNRKWIARGKGGGSEHGNFASPLLCANTFCVWANEMRGYDVETGKLKWSNPAKAFNTYGSMFKVVSGGEPVAAFQWGFFTRIRDGKAIWDSGIFGDSVQTPIVEGNTIFARVGYPKNNKEATGFRSFKVPDSTDAGKLTQLNTFSTDWGDAELVVDKQKNPFDRGFVASPLFVDGLIYQITQGSGLLVHDAATGNLIYRKVLPLKSKTHYWDWAGTSTSPTFAGKYIYLMDNQGTTLVIQPGREYKEVASNFLEELKDGKEQVQNLATPIFEGTRMYYRTPGYLYCIGEK